jgi:hypothetical protein
MPCAMNAAGYSGDNPDGFMTRAEVVDHLEQHASSFGASMCYDQPWQGLASEPGWQPTRHGPGRPGGNMATKRNARPWCNVVGGLVP